MAMKSLVRRRQPEGNPSLVDYLVPATHAGDAILDVIVAQHFVERIEHWHFFFPELAILHLQHRVGLAAQLMVIGALTFFITTFETSTIKSCSITAFVRTKQVDGDAEVEVQIALDRGQVDDSGLA